MRKSIRIENKTIGGNNPSYIIAEIGLNHNKDLELIKELIIAAKESGADAVKFQTYLTENLVLKTSDTFSLFKDLELKIDDFKMIQDLCKSKDITFLSTPFCKECVDWLEEMNVPCYKIASMDTNYPELIKYIAEKQKPVLLSTGMTDLSQIKKAVKVIENTGNEKIILFHTISKYPPEHRDMNFQLIKKLKKKFPYPIGFSDHTLNNTMSIAARAMGCVVFERHFTLDKKLKGPDHSISMTPEELKDLRLQLDALDQAFQNESRERSDGEIRKGAGRSLFAAMDLKTGEILQKEMIQVVRPGTGLPPEYLSVLLDKELKKNIKAGEPFDLTYI